MTNNLSSELKLSKPKLRFVFIVNCKNLSKSFFYTRKTKSIKKRHLFFLIAFKTPRLISKAFG